MSRSFVGKAMPTTNVNSHSVAREYPKLDYSGFDCILFSILLPSCGHDGKINSFPEIRAICPALEGRPTKRWSDASGDCCQPEDNPVIC